MIPSNRLTGKLSLVIFGFVVSGLLLLYGCSGAGGGANPGPSPNPGSPTPQPEGTLTAPFALTTGTVHDGSAGSYESNSYYQITTGTGGGIYYVYMLPTDPATANLDFSIYAASNYSGTDLFSDKSLFAYAGVTYSLSGSTSYYLKVTNVSTQGTTYKLGLYDPTSGHAGSMTSSVPLTVGGPEVPGLVGSATSATDWCSFYSATPSQGGFGELTFSLTAMLPPVPSTVTGACAYSYQDKLNYGNPGFIGSMSTPLNGTGGITLAARSGVTYYFRSSGGYPPQTVRYFIQATYAPVSVQSAALGSLYKPTFSNKAAWVQFTATAGKSYTVTLQDHANNSASYGRDVRLTAYTGSPTQIWGSIDHIASSSSPIHVPAVAASGTVYLGFDTAFAYIAPADQCAIEVDEH